MTDDAPGRFLLIEDKASDAELVSYALQEDYPDHPIEVARSAEEGLEKAARPGLALILTDYKLPRRTGLEILPELRRLVPDAGIILLTGHGDEKVALAAMHEGADYFLRKAEGFILELPLVVREVLEKRRLAVALRQTERWLRTILEYAPDAIFVKDVQGRYLLANPAARHVLSPQNPTLDAVIGKTDAELVGPETAAEFTHTDRLAYDARQPVRGRELEVTPWGTRTWESVKAPVFDDQGRLQGLIGISRDITEQLRREAQARHAEKIQAMGHLVAGVAHELNNPLTGIIGHTELSLRETQDPAVRETLDVVFTQARRAAKIVRNLLAFARPQSRHREMVSLSALVHDVLKSEGPKLKAERIAVELDCPEGIAPVLADPSQMEGVLTNLITNARQAMVEAHGGGRLRIRVGCCRCGQAIGEEREAPGPLPFGSSPLPFAPDGWVELEVVDDGPGIPADVHDTIFTPFFTTKPVGQGTGLGLSLVSSIIKDHNGTIEVRSVSGGGAGFVIHLPAADMAEGKGSGAVSVAETAPDPLFAPRLSPGNRGQVLIIDDEPSVRKFLNAVLEQEGFVVTACAHGEEGLAAIECAATPPCLIFLDFRMPVMGGAEFLSRLEAQRPELVSRVIFCTGDALNPDVQAFLSHYRNVVIAKPFDRATLIAAIRTALGDQG
jgi:PAS domain S-box-containing protein